MNQFTIMAHVFLGAFLIAIYFCFFVSKAITFAILFGIFFLTELILQNEQRLKDIQQRLKDLEKKDSEKKE